MSDCSQSLLNQGANGEFVDNAISDLQHPVVLFSLSWCAYCKSAKRLLEQMGVPYQLYEIDTGEFLNPRLQHQIRARLQELTHSSTLPQIFVGAESIGGYTETYSAMKSGHLSEILKKHNINPPS